ncbi:MAG: DUF4238 domain-containing protein [Actinomycetota bacterium]
MTKPKLHHFVPRFLLRRFSAEPDAENPRLHHLDKGTGKCSVRGVRGEAAIAGYNDLREMEGVPQEFAEHTLALVEDEAASVVANLVEGRALDQTQRMAMALFLYLQYHRTPRGRQWFTYAFEQAYTLDAMRRLLDPREVQELHRLQGEELSLEEAERRGRVWANHLDSGELILKASHDHAVAAMFMFAEGVVPRIAAQMSWVILHAPSDLDFVVSDHPILIHDPQAAPGYGAGWLSSPETVATCPLDRTCALVASPGPPDLRHAEADQGDVEEINLRTYASAEWAIYGPSVAAVQRVRTLAKKQKHRVASLVPAPPTIHILEQQEGQAHIDRVERLRPAGPVRRRQEWPRWD